MGLHLDEWVVRLTTEEEWKILKTVRLESLLDSPEVFCYDLCCGRAI